MCLRRFVMKIGLLIGNSEAAGTQALKIVDKLQALCLREYISAVMQHLYPCSLYCAHFLCSNWVSSKAKPPCDSGKISFKGPK